MKKSYLNYYLGRKFFQFDLSFFRCFFLIFFIFINALFLASTYKFLENKYQRKDSPSSFLEKMNENQPSN